MNVKSDAVSTLPGAPSTLVDALKAGRAIAIVGYCTAVTLWQLVMSIWKSSHGLAHGIEMRGQMPRLRLNSLYRASQAGASSREAGGPEARGARQRAASAPHASGGHPSP